MSSPTSFHIETGDFQTSTRIDDVTVVDWDEHGVKLMGAEGLLAFLPFGEFRYIKDVGPRAKATTSAGVVSATTCAGCAARQVLMNAQTGR